MSGSADASEPTLGEVFRGLGRVEKTVEDGFKAVNLRFDSLDQKFVPRELYEAERDAMNEKIDGSALNRRYWVTTMVSFATACAAVVIPFVH